LANSSKPLNTIPIKNKNVQFFSNQNRTVLINRNTIFNLRSDTLEFEEFANPLNTHEIMSFQAGIFKKEYILFYDGQTSSNYIYVRIKKILHLLRIT
jgi:hypothetical protein